MKQTVDITPHPRILQVLGEIEFKPWQCVAELIDNSVDEFIRSQRTDTPVEDPIVNVAFGRDTVVVKDNGPGMTLDALELAVKAGWTSNERMGNLGLYGIGFNIATARLGSITRIWTTQAGDNEWYGLELDLKKMARGETYNLEVKTRMKSSPSISGTEVEINNIKEDWKELFQKDAWIRTHITERLSRIYGTMLRNLNAQPIKFSLLINNRKVSAWEHCVWPPEWTVYKKSEGDVRPIIEIDQTFGKKYLSRSTGEFYDSLEGLDLDDVIEIPERVYGWIGIQRYADVADFGIDILRYGRKIEIGNKDIFKWEDSDGNLVTEYPIDDPRNRGRIVGEIHLDHGYVHYTKHRFEREHSSWTQLLLAIRKNEPLTNRKNLGYPDVNNSPLGTLYRTFRRNSPQTSSQQKWRDILFIKDNDLAKKWAEKFRKGVQEYLNPDKWLNEFVKLDTPPPADEPEPSPGSDDDILIVGGENEPDSTTDTDSDPNAEPSGNSTPPPPPSRISLPEYNFHITDIGPSGRVYNFETYALEVSEGDSNNSPWQSHPTGRGVYEIEISQEHEAFKSTSLRLIDAILAEIAYIITSEELATVGTASTVNYGDILVTLRSRYSKSDSLDANRLLFEIDEIRKKLAHCLANYLNEEQQREVLAQLNNDDIQRIELAQARGPEEATLLEYININDLAQIAEANPNLLFEAGCLNKSWIPPKLADKQALLELHQKNLFRDVWFPLAELGNFTKQTGSLEHSRDYLSLIRACVNRLKEFSAS